MLKGRKLFFISVTVFLFIFMSFTASAQTAEIEKIEIEKVTLIENSDGFYKEDEGYFWYYNAPSSDIIITYTDGTVEVTDYFNMSTEYDEDMEIEDDQSATNPWTVGTHTVSFNFMGYEGQYEIEIVETPVAKITADDFALTYMGDGEVDVFSSEEGSFIYRNQPKKMEVYYKDGRVIRGSAEGIRELTGYNVEVYDNQYESPWGIGKYKCTAEFMGVTTDFSVTVKESPVKKIAVESITLYRGIDGVGGDMRDDSYEYTAKPEKVTVFYKDGTALTGSPEEIEEATGYEVSYDSGKVWSYGEHTATASYLGASTKFTVNVEPYPIDRVELVKAPTKTQYYAGEYIDISGAVIKVYYTDGRTEELELNQKFNNDYYVSCYLEKIGKTADIICYSNADTFETVAVFEIFDSEFSVDYTVKDEAITDIALSVDSDGFPVLDFTFSDSSTMQSLINDFAGENPAALENDWYSFAIIFTDAGVFDIMIDKVDDEYAIVFPLDDNGEEIRTNFCAGINWAQVTLTERAELIYNNYDGVDAYKGLVASDNIDALLSFAAAGSDAGKAKEIYEDYYIYTATEIQKSIKDFFSLDGIDISCSKNYFSETNTVIIRRLDQPIFYTDSKKAAHPVSYTYENGYFNAEYVLDNGKRMNIVADSNGRVVSYNVADPVIHKHIMVTVSGIKPTYLKTGLTDGVKCSTCGEILTEQKVIDKLILGRTSKIAAAKNTSAIKIAWASVKGATGYELFYKTSSGWKNITTTTATSETFINLPSGKKYTFAVRAYVIEGGKVIKAKTYTTFETSTMPKAPAKIISKQTATALQLQWSKSEGATGYRVYHKNAKGWKSLGETAKTVVTFRNLNPGSKFSFAIRPYIITANEVVWGEVVYYTAATIPPEPATAVASTAKGTITLKYSTVKGADAYQIYYKKGNGKYTLYKNYATAGTLNFKNLKSGDSYTFAIRSATKTSGGWIFSPYTPKSVRVK